jgi:hypothetical protein
MDKDTRFPSVRETKSKRQYKPSVQLDLLPNGEGYFPPHRLTIEQWEELLNFNNHENEKKKENA